MDFNKEEAARARGIAEEKLQNNDFAAARRIALRAKKLDSELENLDHILSVCDVHCAAEIKINGDMDWYGMLQMEKTGDESVVKQQYRKLALLLHPDKNQYPGAETAFNLIGEARIVLLERKNHQLHDAVSAKSASVTTHYVPCPTKKPPVAQNNSIPFVAKPVKKNPTGNQPHAKPKTSTKPGDRISFWTECSVCGYKNDFIVGKLGEPFMCHSCDKSFIPRSMTLGTKSCSEAITPDIVKNLPPSTWFEIFGFDDKKANGSRKRRTVACKPSEPVAKKHRKTSSKATKGM
ncbi:hypothetical protein QQ045_001637 [Rhodiola kirilowii]